MTVFDLRNDAGRLVGFEINSTLVGRWRACRAAQDLGAHVLRWPKRWALDDDQFCEFELDGVRFVVEEPFGDNSRFAVLATDPNAQGAETVVTRVRDSFAVARTLDWRFGAAG